MLLIWLNIFFVYAGCPRFCPLDPFGILTPHTQSQHSRYNKLYTILIFISILMKQKQIEKPIRIKR